MNQPPDEGSRGQQGKPFIVPALPAREPTATPDRFTRFISYGLMLCVLLFVLGLVMIALGAFARAAWGLT